jgi:ABC-type antimicrobial peptide transport system permease subunit
VRGLGMSFLLRRARSSWLLLACITVTVLLTTGLAAMLWTFATAVIPTGAGNILANPQGRVVGISGVATADRAAADSRLIRSTFSQAWPGVSFQMEGALWANPLALASRSTTNTAQIEVASLDGISAQAELTAGNWPGPPHRGGPVPVALPATVASRLHLTVGSVLTGASQDGGAAISMLVTGLFRPADPASPYWAMDLVPISGMGVQGLSYSYAGNSLPGTSTSYGPAVVNPAAFGNGLVATQASWFVLPQVQAMASGNIDALAASTNAVVTQFAEVLPEGLTVTSGLPQLLTGMASSVVLGRSLFTIAALELLLVAGAGLVLAARLLAGLREEESALLRARGATRWQLARPVLAEAVVLAAVAGLAGVLCGSRLASPLASLGDLRLASFADRGITPLAWLSALAVLVLCASVMAWSALHALTPDVARLRRGRQARLAGIAWAGGDLAVVALAAVAVWELHGYSAVAHPVTGSLGIDPVVAIAPALALAGVAIIPLRGLPLLARVADKATDYERRLAAAMVSWHIARRPIRQAGPALLVVVATAAITLGLAASASWRQSAADQASFAVGSDAQVNSTGQLPEAATAAIAEAPGVTSATLASVTELARGQLIALDASTAGKTILLRPDLSPLAVNALWQRITPRSLSGMALPGRPVRLGILASLGAGSQTSAAEVLSDLGSVTVVASIQDAAGNTFSVYSESSLPADGRPQSLIFPLSPPGQAIYPLRLLGITLTYTLPPYDPANPSSAPNVDLTVQSLAVSDTVAGPLRRPFRYGSVLTAWPANAFSANVPTAVAATGPPAEYGQAPVVQGWGAAAGGGASLEFDAGHDPSAQQMSIVALAPVNALASIAILATAPSVVPVIATSGFLSANQLSVGSYTTLSVNGFPVHAQIVASVARFPTVLGQNQAMIGDLAEINDVLAVNQAPLLPVTRWWLRTADGGVPRLPAGLGLSVTGRASALTALLDDPLLKAPRLAMLAIGVAAVLLGVLGFSISVAGSLRSRRTQSAVFAALGVGKNAQAGQLCLEQCVLSVPAAAAGLLAGAGLAWLMVPAITLTAAAAVPVPWVLVIIPFGPAAAAALVTAAVPAAAAALTVVRRPDPAAQLRAEAG